MLHTNIGTIETVVEYARRKGVPIATAKKEFVKLHLNGQARLYWLAWLEGEDQSAPPLAIRPFHGEVYPPMLGVEFMLGAVLPQVPEKPKRNHHAHFGIRPFNVELHRPEVE